MARQRSRDIHVAQPLDSLRSPFGPAFGCYSASLRFTTIALGLLKGAFGRSNVFAKIFIDVRLTIGVQWLP